MNSVRTCTTCGYHPATWNRDTCSTCARELAQLETADITPVRDPDAAAALTTRICDEVRREPGRSVRDILECLGIPEGAPFKRAQTLVNRAIRIGLLRRDAGDLFPGRAKLPHAPKRYAPVVRYGQSRAKGAEP